MSGTLATGSGTVAAPWSIRGNDLYETPPEAVRALLALYGHAIPDTVWEPACGPGSIVREIRQSGRNCIATDLVDYGLHDSESGIDFLMERATPAGANCIVTNPPFKNAEAFAFKARELVSDVWMLLRLAFLEGLRWQDRGLSDGLADVIVFAPRLPFMHRAGYDGPKNSSSGMAFAWFHWRDGHKSPPAVQWADWRQYRAPLEAAR